MANHEIDKEYSEELRKIKTTDPVHADTLNPLYGQLINNDAYLKEKVTAHQAEMATSTQLGHVKVGQNLAIDSDGTLHAQASGGKKVARFVIGTSTAGWTENDVDYLCDGTSDHVEINQAIQDLPVDGGEITILSGIYNIGAKIDVNKNNVTIRGNGDATILKRMWDSDSAEGVITLNSVSNCKIENLQIDGNKSTYTLLHNHGIYLDSSSNNTVTGNTCNNNNISGIYLDSSSNNTVTGNTCNNNDSGIRPISSSENIVTGNTFNNNIRGIRLSSGSNENTITGNTCNNNNISGIYLDSSSNNTVTGNTCNNNIISGIYLDSSSNNTVTGNTCNNNDSNGIHLLSSSGDNVVVGNNTSGSSIGIDDSGSGNVVGNNKT